MRVSAPVIRDAIQDLNRVRQIVMTAGKYGFGSWLERAGIRRIVGAAPMSDVASTASAALRFRLALEELGPTFVKLGQIMSTRADLLPAALIEELATLTDRAPPFPFAQVDEQIREAFGRPASEVFGTIESEPLAAASIAQVHRARTLDGDDVVVKVQRPTVAAQLQVDISALRQVARMLEAVIEEFAIYRPTAVVDEFERAVQDELDFLHEATNVRDFAAASRNHPGVKIPKVYDELTARTVLTLEYLDGPSISAATLDDAAKKTLAKLILASAFEQVFEDGLFHADPHPGNLLVLSGPVLGLVDFGLVGRITPEMQDNLVSLALALTFRDAESIAKLLYRLGTPDARTNLVSFRRDIDNLFHLHRHGTLDKYDARAVIRDLLNLAINYRLRVPREYAVLARASIAIEGVLRMLYPDMPVAQTLLPYTRRVLAERFNPAQIPDGVMKAMLRLQDTANELPLQLTQILMDMQSGKFTVNFRAEQIRSVNESLRSMAVVIFSGLCACGFIIGIFLVLANEGWRIGGFPTVAVVGIVATLGLAATALVRHSMGGFRKISLRKLLLSKTSRD